MIKYLLCLLFSLPVYSAITLEIQSAAPMVNQGELIEVNLGIQTDSASKLELQKLKGSTVNETIYFYDISPLFRKEDGKKLEAQAKIIFVKVPETQNITGNLNGEVLKVNLSGLQINQTEGAQGYQFGNFEVPRPSKVMEWMLGIVLTLALLLAAGTPLWQKIKRKKAQKLKMQTLKAQILGCRTYEDVVELWKAKHQHLSVFPHVKEPFTKLEEVLNKYQFKPRQSEEEKQQVLEAYRRFTNAVEGGFVGI